MIVSIFLGHPVQYLPKKESTSLESFTYTDGRFWWPKKTWANAVLPEMATGRQIGDFWSILGDKIFEIYLLNGDFSRENLLSDGDFSANLF